jgi:hypothetical protein
MGNTPNFAIPYPEPTDFVADGANQMENLAERSDDALYALGMGRNRLINGDFRVAQRGTNFQAGANNDNTYNLDRWVVLSDGNDIVDINQSNVAPSGGLFSIGLDVETVNKKFGILQVIETRNIVGMFNQPVTLSFSARTSGTSIGNMKAVILAWTGTADTVTRDVVSAWGADGVTPTFAANWTAENTPQNLAPSNSWTRYEITANLDTASTNNVAVFIWCDDMTTTLGDFLYITDVQLEVGALATPFERKPFSTVLADCQRYYYRVNGQTGTSTRLGIGQVYSGVNLLANVPYPVTMRAIPTALEQSGTASEYAVTNSVASGIQCSVVPQHNIASPNAGTVVFTVPSGLTAGNAGFALGNGTANAYLGWSVEL